MNRIPTCVFYVSTVTDSSSIMNMNDRNSYELMINLLNSYFNSWGRATEFLVEKYDSCIYEVKRLIGRKFSDKEVKEEIGKLPFKILSIA